jgi:hypothetical protein
MRVFRYRLEGDLQFLLGDRLMSAPNPSFKLLTQWPEQRRQRKFLASVERVFVTRGGPSPNLPGASTIA